MDCVTHELTERQQILKLWREGRLSREEYIRLLALHPAPEPKPRPDDDREGFCRCCRRYSASVDGTGYCGACQHYG